MNQSEEIKSAEAVAESKYPKKRGNYWKSYNVIQQEKQDAFISGFKYANHFKSEWVSIEDGLPESGVKVRAIRTFVNGKMEEVHTVYIERTQCFDDFMTDIITHWQPITPPKV